MATAKEDRKKKRFVRVKDDNGTEYVCRIEDLKKFEEMTEAEKAMCFQPPPAFE